MNWLRHLLACRVARQRFSPWQLLAIPGDAAEGTWRAGLHEKGRHAPAPGGDSFAEEALGIGACTAWPCEGHTVEETCSHGEAISVSERDVGLLRRLVASALTMHAGPSLEYARVLADELCHAKIVPDARFPRNVVTLNSRVSVKDLDTGTHLTVTIVTPDQAAASRNRVSILSPLGMALFGYKAGRRVEWGTPQHPLRLLIRKVRPPRQSRARRFRRARHNGGRER